MTEPPSAGPVVYIDRSDIQAGRWDELRDGITSLVAFVDCEQPQMAAYGFYLDEEANQMTVLAVHPDSASLERHVEVGASQFEKLAPLLDLRAIEVFGLVSDRAVALLHEKSAALGEEGSLTLHTRFAGFDRPPGPHTEPAIGAQRDDLGVRALIGPCWASAYRTSSHGEREDECLRAPPNAGSRRPRADEPWRDTKRLRYADGWSRVGHELHGPSSE